MTFLVDTKVISELIRRAPNPGVRAWASRVSRVALSVVSLEEIHYGLRWKPNPRVEEWLQRFLAEAVTLISVDEAVARSAGILRGASQARGQTRTQADMLIAASALVHQLTLVTRNVADFTDCGIAVLNPFE